MARGRDRIDQCSNVIVIGWYQGKSEWGPRALGNRSILADPHRESMKEVVNSKIKFRELFRPFAPSVTVEAAADTFDITEVECHYPSRFMLYRPGKTNAKLSLQ